MPGTACSSYYQPPVVAPHGYIGDLNCLLPKPYVGIGSSLRHPESVMAQTGTVSYLGTFIGETGKNDKLKERKTTMMGEFKDYIKAHRDLLFTVVFVLLLDHFVFGGAFKEKLQSVVGGLMKKAENQLGVTDGSK